MPIYNFRNLLILLLAAMPLLGIGQTISPDNRIVVLGEATIEIPADRVEFNIELKFDDSTNIKRAYKRHKEAESKLVSYLKELNIPPKNINYSLINIGKTTDYNDETNKSTDIFGTNQKVFVTIDDVKQYADVMMKLITAGFTDVSTSFGSSKENDFQQTLIEKAIEAARKKALVMAKAANREISKIVKVSDTEESDPTFGGYGNSYAAAMAVMGDANSENVITEIPQTITKRMTVKVVFALK
jgi:uncharacterized protein